MSTSATPSLFPDELLTPPAPASTVRSEALAVLVRSRSSRRTAWTMLRNAGITAVSLPGFYAMLREHGLHGACAWLCAGERAERVDLLLATPPPPEPRRVGASTLANQFYCELQVHLGTLHDVRVATPQLSAGASGHAALEAEAEPVTQVEVARRIRDGEHLGLAEMPLAAELEGVAIAGRADRVQLAGSTAQLVLEWKFSARRELQASHVVQVETYGALLAAQGFVVDTLVHAVAILSRGTRRPAGIADVLATHALTLAAQGPWPARTVQNPAVAPAPLTGLSLRRLDTEAFSLFVFANDPRATERDLHWALAYWKGLRPPAPTNVPSRCRACSFNAAGLCPTPRATPDGRYAVRTTDGPRGVLHLVTARR